MMKQIRKRIRILEDKKVDKQLIEKGMIQISVTRPSEHLQIKKLRNLSWYTEMMAAILAPRKNR